MDKKNKQKRRLYTIRNFKKLCRNKRNREGKRRYLNIQSSERIEYNLIPSYMKVIRHLDEKLFGLNDERFILNKTAYINVPEIFSISEKPNETIRFLRQLYALAKSDKINKMKFDHSQCKMLGLSASTIMDIIVYSTMKYREKQNSIIDYEGELPMNASVRDILLASGLPRHLGAEYKMQYDESHVETFEMVMGECGAPTKISGRVSTSMTNYFNKCLRKQGMELNDDGTLLLSRILGEVINNCEIHGDNESTWYTQGYYKTQGSDSYGEMQLLFLNIGNTIYEGLKYNSSKETQVRLKCFLQKHRKYMSSEWNEEIISTVFALQQGISRLRDREIEGYEARGTGTVRLIEQMHIIGESESGLKPRMTVVSGKAYIDFSGTYKMQNVRFDNDRVFGNGQKKIIAFNEENNIYRPADSSKVKRLQENFPGTIISLKFYLDSRYIQKKQKGGQ